MVGIILLFLVSFLFPVNANTMEKTVLPTTKGTIFYVGGSGPGNYTSIQAAINNSTNGNTIDVYPGDYNEHLIINKTLFLNGIPGEGLDRPTISGGDYWAVTFEADGCLFQEFNVTNNGYPGAIKLHSDHNTIRNCTVLNSNDDLYYDHSSYNSIMNNTLSGGWRGMRLFGSSYNTIENNMVRGHTYAEIILNEASNNNMIQDNDFSNSWIVYGIENHGNSSNNVFQGNIIDSNNYGGILIDSGFNLSLIANTLLHNGIMISASLNAMLTYTIENNSINSKPLCFYKNRHAIDVPSNAAQVIFVNCANSSAQNLTLEGVDVGILLQSCSYMQILNNKITTCDYGIMAMNVNNSTLSNNILTDDSEGIRLSASGYDTISENTIGGTGNAGIRVSSLSYTIISSNKISRHWYGIDLFRSDSNRLTRNKVSLSDKVGVLIDESKLNELDHNDITANKFGLEIEDSPLNIVFKNNINLNVECGLSLDSSGMGFTTGNLIKRNNFIGNVQSATFFEALLNRWVGNYWNIPRVAPKIIIGVLFADPFMGTSLPWFNVDWRPARIPNI